MITNKSSKKSGPIENIVVQRIEENDEDPLWQILRIFPVSLLRWNSRLYDWTWLYTLSAIKTSALALTAAKVTSLILLTISPANLIMQ